MDDHSSVTSALTREDADQSTVVSEVVHDPFETATTVGEVTLASNASDASNYFMPHYRPSDSLCYSSTSSCENTLASLYGSSLQSQQAFPSSMFPGQKLLAPTHTKAATGDNEKNRLSNPHSYYYYSSTPPKQQRQVGAKLNSHHLPVSYQNNNVYQKRSTDQCFNTDSSSRQHDDESLSSWRGAFRCLFSPRVLATVLVCVVILFNLLRASTTHHRNHLKHTNTSRRPVDSRADYIRLETIGTGLDTNSEVPWDDSVDAALSNESPRENSESVFMQAEEDEQAASAESDRTDRF